MKAFAFLMCLLGSSLAAPAPDSGSNEEGITGHANTALQLMELYRMLGQLQQQGFGAVASPAQQPAAPAAPAPVDAQPQVLPQRPEQHFFFNPALLAQRGDGSDEEGAPQFRGFYPPYGYQPAQPAAPLNSDEAEGGEEAAVPEGAEATEGAEAGAEAAPEPTGGAPAVDAGVANEILPVNVAMDIPVTAVDPAPDIIATAAATVDPALIPQEPSVTVEIDTTMVGPEVATGGEQVLVAEAPGAGLTV
ncbi:enamelin [Myxocyprinus asiaticus]|uniref:enamelin n=1 Tax=Myxocyprinus asiaticus TaxID=70543 RepID=UPI0022223FB4|nr:enamelin [Myxocyprinus asiaticus]